MHRARRQSVTTRWTKRCNGCALAPSRLPLIQAARLATTLHLFAPFASQCTLTIGATMVRVLARSTPTRRHDELEKVHMERSRALAAATDPGGHSGDYAASFCTFCEPAHTRKRCHYGRAVCLHGARRQGVTTRWKRCIWSALAPSRLPPIQAATVATTLHLFAPFASQRTLAKGATMGGPWG